MKSKIFKKCSKLAIVLITLSLLFSSVTISIGLSISSEEDTFKLRTSVSPENSGIIELRTEGGEKDKDGIFESGTIVIAQAIPSNAWFPSYEFDYWSGDASGTDPTVEILMDRNKIICANFVLENGGSGLKPIAEFSYSPSDPVVADAVIFDASASYDPNGHEIVDYSWSYTFIDPSSLNPFPQHMGNGVQIEYSWELYGTYKVNLTVTNDKGRTGFVEKQVIIGKDGGHEEDPILGIDPGKFDFDSVAVGEIIQGTLKVFNKGRGLLEFDILVPDTFLGANEDNFEFFPTSGVSNGLDDIVNIEFMVWTIGLEPGNYGGRIDIISNGGNAKVDAGVSLYSPDSTAKPVADFFYSPISPFVGELVQFNASPSYDPYDGEIVSYTWYYSDESSQDSGGDPTNSGGSADDSKTSDGDPTKKPNPGVIMGTGEIIEYTFEKVGKYYVTLKVEDSDGETNETTRTIYVQDEEHYKIDIIIVTDPPAIGGRVILNPPGEVYYKETTVTLTALPNEGYSFDHWEGDAQGNDSTVELFMDSDKEVTAFFLEDIENKFVLNVNVAPYGAGSVDLDPSGGLYDPETTVTLSASAFEGYTFDHWSGDAEGSESSIEIIMDSDKNIDAVFVPNGGTGLSVSIIKPAYNYLYVGGFEMPLNTSTTMVPIIIGALNVEVEIENAQGEVTLELLVDGELKLNETTTESNAILIWNEKIFLLSLIHI